MDNEQNKKNDENSNTNTTSPVVNNSAEFEQLSREFRALEKLLGDRDAELRTIKLKQAGDGAKLAFQKSKPGHIPEQFVEALYDHAVAKGHLEVSEAGWQWKGATDPLKGAEAFWENYKTVQVAAPTIQTPKSQIGVPINSSSQPQTLGSLMSFLTQGKQ